MRKAGAPAFSPSLQLSTQTHRVVRTEARGGRGRVRAPRPSPKPPPRGAPWQAPASGENPTEHLQRELGAGTDRRIVCGAAVGGKVVHFLGAVIY